MRAGQALQRMLHGPGSSPRRVEAANTSYILEQLRLRGSRASARAWPWPSIKQQQRQPPARAAKERPAHRNALWRARMPEGMAMARRPHAQSAHPVSCPCSCTAVLRSSVYRKVERCIPSILRSGEVTSLERDVKPRKPAQPNDLASLEKTSIMVGSVRCFPLRRE